MKKLVITLTILIPFIAFTQQHSNLSSGDWYKIAVEETGVYKITYNDLENYGIDVGNINPQKLAIFGNPAGMLPESTEENYYTDIQPLAIQVIGEDDGIFDPQDYILFFGQKPNVLEHNELTNRFHYVTNIYTKQTHYFLTIGSEVGKRIQIEQSTTLDPTGNPYLFDYLIYHESELVNPGKTGKIWLGEDFSDFDSLTYHFDFRNTFYQDSNYFKTVLAVNCTEESYFTIKINGEFYCTINANSINDYNYYHTIQFDSLCTAGNLATEIKFIYHKPNDSAQAWIDYFEMEMKIMLTFVYDSQISYRTTENVGVGEITRFSLSYNTPENITIWNVTDPMNVQEEELTLSSASVSYRLPTDSLLEFHAFNGNLFYSAEFIEQLENQNLHGLTPPDYLIITHPMFIDAANQLADIHNNEGDLSTTVITTNNIYNEFSSGAQDISAIRNFVVYLREKSESDSKPNYLLLFGDASYDYLDRIENNTNFVPTFESLSSNNIVTSFASDQFFALNNMGGSGEMQLAVGRIPVSTAEEAINIVNKIQTYNSAKALGAYKNEMIFIADNGDNNLHMAQAESLIEIIGDNDPTMNINKCYLDFFELIQTNDGPRYPEVNAIITNKTNDGLFYANYTGHGSKEFLSQEQILTTDDLGNWTNDDYMPLWVIASTDVVRFDNPHVISLGEDIFTMNEAGAIALIGTTCASYAHSNFAFNKAIIEKLSDNTLQSNLRFGDLIMHSTGNANDLKWTLLGDPALKIHFPKFNVTTLALNNIDIEDYTDTISPGSFLTFTGQITNKDDASLQADFNGTVYLKIFAPQYIRTTLGNQGPSVDIEVQDSILIEGTADVNFGEFEINVHLPANYFENYGNLKLSWYAENGTVDANGYYNQLVFGGDPDAITENNEFLDQIKVYPTIFTNYINIELPKFDSKSIVYHLYNSMGVEVYSTKSESATGIEKIYLPRLANGMYILNAYIGNESRNFKVFK
ncbi:MAG: type IX secretion system sortase PorU [Bacteroidota bacterium]